VDLTAATVAVSTDTGASVVPADNKQIRVRGGLVSSSTTANDFVLNVQPFHDQTRTTGQVTVGVATSTTYQVNGTAYVGAAGLAAIAALPADTMVAAFGTLQKDTQTFTAAAVLAGTSLENPAKDLVSGTVIARTANTLTLRRATVWWHGGGDFESENHDVTVTVADGTAGHERGRDGGLHDRRHLGGSAHRCLRHGEHRHWHEPEGNKTLMHRRLCAARIDSCLGCRQQPRDRQC